MQHCYIHSQQSQGALHAALIPVGLIVLQDTLASQQKRHHWDKRKRRYIQLQPNEEVKAGKRLRTESGGRGVSEDAPSGLYQKWAKANKRHVVHGAQENSSAAAYSKDLANRYAVLVPDGMCSRNCKPVFK